MHKYEELKALLNVVDHQLVQNNLPLFFRKHNSNPYFFLKTLLLLKFHLKVFAWQNPLAVFFVLEHNLFVFSELEFYHIHHH